MEEEEVDKCSFIMSSINKRSSRAVATIKKYVLRIIKDTPDSHHVVPEQHLHSWPGWPDSPDPDGELDLNQTLQTRALCQNVRFLRTVPPGMHGRAAFRSKRSRVPA